MKLKRFLTAALTVSLLPVSAYGEESLTAELNMVPAEIKQSGDLIHINFGNGDAGLLGLTGGDVSAFSDEPEAYNNDIDNLSYVSEVKSQGSYGTCWAFSGIACLETALMKKNGIKTTSSGKYDFSELHTALALSDTCLKDGIYGFAGYETVNSNGKYLQSGGNAMMVDMYATRGESAEDNTFVGPVYESYLEYDSDIDSIIDNPSESMNVDTAGYYPAAFTTLNFVDSSGNGIYLSGDEINERNELIKDLTDEYGAVSVSVYCGESSDNNNQGYIENSDGDYVFYQNNCDNTSNHAVTIVGYDDSYSASNFSGFASELDAADGSRIYSSTPSIDGAFIVKNSWGSSWGNSGFFYMSYGTHMDSMSAFGDLKERSTYDNEYDNAPYNPIGSVSYSFSQGGKYAYSAICAANVFEKQSSQPEILNKVSVYVTAGDATINLYADRDASEESGRFDNFEKLAVKASDGGSVSYQVSNSYDIYVPYPGNYVFELAEPVLIDNDFTVMAYVKSENTAVIGYEMSYYLNGKPGVVHDDSNPTYFSPEVTGSYQTMSGVTSPVRAYTQEIDAAGLLKYVSEISSDSDKYSKADINNDNKVDILDVIDILKVS